MPNQPETTLRIHEPLTRMIENFMSEVASARAAYVSAVQSSPLRITEVEKRREDLEIASYTLANALLGLHGQGKCKVAVIF